MVKEFAASDFASVENVGNPTRMTVIRRPDLLAAKIQGYRRLKDYHRQVTREQKGED